MADHTQYVTLGAGSEVFAIPVANVREILDVPRIVSLPHAPVYLLGMIDVRGESVPVIDLRRKLGLVPTEVGPSTRILVLDIIVEERSLVLGLMADSVYEVTGLDDGRLDPPPEVGGRWRSHYIAGIGRRQGAFVVVFDLSRLFSTDEAILVESPVAGGPVASDRLYHEATG